MASVLLPLSCGIGLAALVSWDRPHGLVASASGHRVGSYVSIPATMGLLAQILYNSSDNGSKFHAIPAAIGLVA